MLFGQRLIINQSPRAIWIRFRWFSLLTFWYLFFTFVIICAGFIAMYMREQLGLISQIVGSLFTIIGIYMSYNTLCLLFNKTIIEIDRDHLTLKTYPIPVWKGNNILKTDNIKYFQADTFGLKVITTNNSGEIYLLKDSNQTNTHKKIAQILTNFLGTNKERYTLNVEKGIYQRKEVDTPRRLRRSFSPLYPFQILDAEKEDVVDIGNDLLKIEEIKQFDWENEQIDRHISLTSLQQTTLLLLVAFKEKEARFYQLQTLSQEKVDFDIKKIGRPKYRIQYKDTSYDLVRTNKGRSFVSKVLSETAVQQWVFKEPNQQTILIIQKYLDRIEIFIGQQLDNWLFEQQLELKEHSKLHANNMLGILCK